MRFRFKRKKLEKLYFEGKGIKAYPKNVVDNFYIVMTIIEAAVDERDLRALKGLRFEKLKLRKPEQYSIRLNEQFRLVFAFERDESGKILVIIDIEDYH